MTGKHDLPELSTCPILRHIQCKVCTGLVEYFFCCLIQYPDQPHGEPLAVMECWGDVAGIGKHTCQEGGVASLFYLRESQVRVSMHLLIPAFFWDVAQ